MVRSRRLELPRVAPQRPQRCASTNSATTARGGAGHRSPLSKAGVGYQIGWGIARNGAVQHFRVMDDAIQCSVAATAGPPIALMTSPGLVPYPDAVAAMEARVAGIRAGTAEELVWFLEHPPIYTAGT